MIYVLADEVEKDLDEIVRFSAGVHGLRDADLYLSRLYAGFDEIAERPDLGELIGRRGLKWRLLTREPGDVGHLAVYQIKPDRVVVLRVFHTRQNWQRKVRSIRPVPPESE